MPIEIDNSIQISSSRSSSAASSISNGGDDAHEERQASTEEVTSEEHSTAWWVSKFSYAGAQITAFLGPGVEIFLGITQPITSTISSLLMRFRHHADAEEAITENMRIENEIQDFSIAMLGDEQTSEILASESLVSAAQKERLRKVHIGTSVAYTALLSAAVAGYYYAGQQLNNTNISTEEISHYELIQNIALAGVLVALTTLLFSNLYTSRKESQQTNSTYTLLSKVMNATRKEYLNIEVENEDEDEDIGIEPEEDGGEVFVLASDVAEEENSTRPIKITKV
ncbi:MAG: hypothetical protein DHS20C10_06270 [marine bacterium B5-7]|nr:MAG: hypothetical protein DHS20C10_06270 [marine bacterium B5-7]